MNELFVLLDTVAGLGWALLCLVAALAAGGLIFDRSATRAEHTDRHATRPDLRHAA